MERPVNYELRFIFLFSPRSSAGRGRGSYNDDWSLWYSRVGTA